MTVPRKRGLIYVILHEEAYQAHWYRRAITASGAAPSNPLHLRRASSIASERGRACGPAPRQQDL